MKRLSSIIFTVVIACSLCSFQKRKTTSVLVSSYYDKKHNITSYTVLPYGNVYMPGKWKKYRYNDVSYQQFFTNGDSTDIAVSIVAVDNFEFSKPGLNGFPFVKAWVEWESDYQSKSLHNTVELIRTDSVNNYILWHTYGDQANTFLLAAPSPCRCDGGAARMLSVFSAKMSNEEMVKLLEAINTATQSR